MRRLIVHAGARHVLEPILYRRGEVACCDEDVVVVAADEGKLQVAAPGAAQIQAVGTPATGACARKIVEEALNVRLDGLLTAFANAPVRQRCDNECAVRIPAADHRVEHFDLAALDERRENRFEAVRLALGVVQANAVRTGGVDVERTAVFARQKLAFERRVQAADAAGDQ